MEYTSEYALKPGDRAPDFRDLPGVDGKTWSLSSFDGKDALVVLWWCNHCPYVRAWEERTVALAREYQGRGVAFVAINANETENYPTDDMPHMAERAREKGYPFAYLRDDSQKVAEAYGATVTPHYQVFDGGRRLVYQGKLDDNKENPQAVRRRFVREALDAVLAGKDAPELRTDAVGCSVKWKR